MIITYHNVDQRYASTQYISYDEYIEENDESVYVPGELIIKLKPDISLEIIDSDTSYIMTNLDSLNRLHEKYHVYDLKSVFPSVKFTCGDLLQVYKLKFSGDFNIHSIIDSYENNHLVEYAEPNYVYGNCVGCIKVGALWYGRDKSFGNIKHCSIWVCDAGCQVQIS